MSFIAGPDAQGHAHRGQGSLIIHPLGRLAYDARVEPYVGTRQDVDAHGAVRFIDRVAIRLASVGTATVTFHVTRSAARRRSPERQQP